VPPSVQTVGKVIDPSKSKLPVEEIRNNGRTNHIVSMPPGKPELHSVRDEEPIVKFKPAPVMVNHVQGNLLAARPIGGNAPHFAAFGGRRRGFMR
jgi:hypothetical protein